MSTDISAIRLRKEKKIDDFDVDSNPARTNYVQLNQADSRRGDD